MNFKFRVLTLVKKIPKGKVTTYKEIGRALKKRGQIYRAIGRALHDNEQPTIIPCHRVVASNGSVGGYSRGIRKKIDLLRREGIIIKNNKIVDFGKKLYRFIR